VGITLQLMGLDGCADTFVGSNIVRGVSGGERHRVTTGCITVHLIFLFF
jgi:hypothetical protein